MNNWSTFKREFMATNLGMNLRRTHPRHVTKVVRAMNGQKHKKKKKKTNLMTRKELFGDRERQHKRLHDEKKTKMTTRVELDGEAAPQEPATNDAANDPTEALRVSVPATWEGRGAGGGAYMGGYSVSSSSLKVSLGGDSHAAAISFSFSASVKKKK